MWKLNKQAFLQAVGVKGNTQSFLLSDVTGLENKAGDHFPDRTTRPLRLPLALFIPLDGHKGIIFPDSP